MTIKIILADDHKIVCDGMISLLGKEEDMEVVACAENGQEAVRMARNLMPDVIIMDISMPDLNGFEATRQIIAKNPEIKVIALSMHSDKRFVARMFNSGASGYLLKDCAFDELARSIRVVMSGQQYLCPAVTSAVIEDYIYHLDSTISPGFSCLTNREREVLQLLAEGKSTKQIAGFLYVSGKTIETHRKRIMTKLNLYSVAELTKYAIREGVTFLEK